MARYPHELHPNADFNEKNEIAQGMSIPRSVPRFTSLVEDLAAGRELPVKPGEISVLDLPDDVKKNLVGYGDMELDQLILKSLALFPTAIIVDRLIMVLWQVHQYSSADRARVIKRLRLMAKQGLVAKVAGTKGSYHLTDAGKAMPGVSA